MEKFAKRVLSRAMKNIEFAKNGVLVRAKDDRIADPLTRKRRWRTDDDGEGYREYGFVGPDEMIYDYDPDVETLSEAYEGLTDEEVSDWFEENMAIRIWSPYDCTGKPFTAWIDWHRNPCGLISFVHHVEYDL